MIAGKLGTQVECIGSFKNSPTKDDIGRETWKDVESYVGCSISSLTDRETCILVPIIGA